MLAASAGFPDEAYPIAGDFDGDGDDELGLFDFRDIERLPHDVAREPHRGDELPRYPGGPA